MAPRQSSLFDIGFGLKMAGREANWKSDGDLNQSPSITNV